MGRGGVGRWDLPSTIYPTMVETWKPKGMKAGWGTSSCVPTRSPPPPASECPKKQTPGFGNDKFHLALYGSKCAGRGETGSHACQDNGLIDPIPVLLPLTNPGVLLSG